MPDVPMSDRRLCVFTVLIGRYELLNEQPVAAQSHIPFICLTDDPDLRSDTWQLRRVSPAFAMDPARSQRDLKLRPHIHLPDFDASLYIDNSVLLSEPPERIFALLEPKSTFCVPHHSYRETVLDEFLAVAELGRDDPGRVFEQLNHYLLDCPDVLREKPYWAAIMLRDHRDPAVKAALDTWWSHVMRYSRRDQLSVNLAFRQTGLVPQALSIPNEKSWFHSWPRSRHRDPASARPYTTLIPPVGRLRALELSLAESAERARLEADLRHAAEKMLEEERARVAEGQARIQEHERLLAERDEQARNAERALIAHRDSLIAHCDSLIAHRDSMARSMSWRMTAPARAAVRRFPGLRWLARTAFFSSKEAPP